MATRQSCAPAAVSSARTQTNRLRTGAKSFSHAMLQILSEAGCRAGCVIEKSFVKGNVS
jgi:hypothetical protein